MKALLDRAGRIAQAAVEKRIEAIEAAVGADLPGVRVRAEAGGIAVSGRGLLRRWLANPAFRFLADGAR